MLIAAKASNQVSKSLPKGSLVLAAPLYPSPSVITPGLVCPHELHSLIVMLALRRIKIAFTSKCYFFLGFVPGCAPTFNGIINLKYANTKEPGSG